MPVSRCPTCDAVRPPNATYCPSCGGSFDRVVSPGANALREREVEFTFWTAIKFGAGLAIGASAVAMAAWAVLAILILIGINMPSVR